VFARTGGMMQETNGHAKNGVRADDDE